MFLMESCGAAKQVVVKPGYVLNYDVITNQKSVRLAVTMGPTKSDWSFDYEIPEEKIIGSVYMRKEAITNSSELFHSFNGVDKILTTSTSLRISDSTFESLQNGKATELSYRLGFVKNTYKYKVTERQKLKYLIDGKLKTLDVLYIEDTSNKGHTLWVWDNPTSPMILRLKFGYEVILKEIKLP